MSKVVHPYAHRLVVLRDWRSRWITDSKKYVDLLKSDVMLRQYLEKKLKTYYISGIEFERNQKSTKIIIRTSRPGMLIGRNGEGSIKLKADILKFASKNKLAFADDVKIDVLEVQNPDADAKIVALTMAEAIEKKMPYRRVMKQTIDKVMAVRGIKGVKIYIGGRLGGAEISRSEELKRGSLSLQTFRADIDYAQERANLPYGVLGIKVWINRGEVFAEGQKIDNHKNA
jgi:small subunit ribosomal protein S3